MFYRIKADDSSRVIEAIHPLTVKVYLQGMQGRVTIMRCGKTLFEGSARRARKWVENEIQRWWRGDR